MKPLPPSELAKRIDYAVLRNPTPSVLENAVEEAERLGLRAITTYYTMLEWLEGMTRKVKISIVIDFPSGASHIESKIKAVEQAIAHGADEIEFVANIWSWLRGSKDYFVNEVRALSRIAREVGVVSKVIIESSLLTPLQLEEVLKTIAGIGEDDRPHYVKMNTGWFQRGVSSYDVMLAARIVKPRGVLVKAAGGIRDALWASTLVSLGADVIGASKPKEIIEEAERLIRLS